MVLTTYLRTAFAFFERESDSVLDQLFFRSDALTRQLSAPLVDERGQYLTHCPALQTKVIAAASIEVADVKES
jgi:hypothetical protein